MEKYNLYLTNKEGNAFSIEGIETSRVPVKGEIVPFNLINKDIFRDWYAKYRSYFTNKEISESEIESRWNSFNGRTYEVENVHHELKQMGHPNCGRLETKLNVFAVEKEKQ